MGLDQRDFAVDDKFQILVLGERRREVDNQLELGTESDGAGEVERGSAAAEQSFPERPGRRRLAPRREWAEAG